MIKQTIECTAYGKDNDMEEIDCASGGHDEYVRQTKLTQIEDGIYYYRKFSGNASLDGGWNVCAEIITQPISDKIDESKDSTEYDVKWDKPKYADPKWTPEFEEKFKADDRRTSWSGAGIISYDEDGRPLIPIEVEKLVKGRGVLWSWGPNKAVDAIITRKHPETECLQLLVVKRRDNGKWAIPGGMLPLGKENEIHIMGQLRQELKEEALSQMTEDECMELDNVLDSCTTIYQGYMPDPRNCKNAWMETAGLYCHLPDNLSSKLSLQPAEGEDTTHAVWADLNLAYKKVTINKEIIAIDKDLEPYDGEELTLFAGHTEHYIVPLFKMYEERYEHFIQDIIKMLLFIYLVVVLFVYLPKCALF